MLNISKKLLLLNIVLSQTILVIIAIILSFFIKGNWLFFEPFLKIEIRFDIFLISLAGILFLLFFEFLCWKFISKENFFDELNLILIEKFSLAELSIIFLSGSIVEEMLFRGIIQPFVGILAANIVFTLIHFRYFSKKYMLLEVFVIGIVLGIIYKLTLMLYVPILCHFIVNLITAMLVKKGYLNIKAQ